MTRTMDAASVTASVRVDPTVGFRRIAGALALPLAFALQAGCNALYAIASTGNAGDSGSGTETLSFYAAHASELRLATVLSLIGSLLVAPGILAALRVLRTSRPRLSLIAGVLMIAGYICYFGVVTTGFDSLALAEGGVDAGAAMDAVQADAAALWIFLLFVVGNLVGTLLLGIAVILSKQVPWVAGALIIGWPVGHVTNLIVGNEWFAVAGGVLEVIGLSLVAAAAVRMSNTEWATRG